MATRMLQRRGTAAEWAAANPVLGDGEVGVERDTGVVKIGDGVAAWAALTNAYRRFIDSVAKAGDTMTGDLVINKPDAALLLQETATDRLRAVADSGTQYIQVDDALHITGYADPATMKNLRAGEIYDSGNRVYSPSNPQPATNPFAVVDAAGDLLVGSANDAVARLAKGPNGSVLTVSSGGVVVWQTPVDASTKVSKTGDTMTGRLILPSGLGVLIGDSLLREDNGAFRMVNGADNSWRNLNAGGVYGNAGVYDNGNRVYSASNPPPESGMKILAGIATVAQSTGDHSGNATFDFQNSNTSFVAPSSGRIQIHISVSMYTSPIDKVGYYITQLESKPTASSQNPLYFIPDGAAVEGKHMTFYRGGLTPGSTYNIQLWGKSLSGQNVYASSQYGPLNCVVEG